MSLLRVYMATRRSSPLVLAAAAAAATWVSKVGLQSSPSFTALHSLAATNRLAGSNQAVSAALLGPHSGRSRSMATSVAASADGDLSTAASGLEVELQFTLTRVDNAETIDSSEGKAPLKFVAGEGEVFPAIDQGVIGMNIGDTKEISVSGADGYGEYDKERVISFPAEKAPPDATPGQMLRLQGPNGPMMAKVLERSETEVMLDFNHPLAGVDCSMTVTLLGVGKPPEVVVETLSSGDGSTYPKSGDQLTMHYTGTLAESGTKFDSSLDRGEPFCFQIGVGQVIRGWDVGVMKMSLGEKAILKIPSEMGYGATGAGGVIPPGADLVFEVELLKIN